MRSKDSPNLYEILKQSTNGGEAPPPETQPRAVTTAVETAAVEPTKPSAPRITVPPRPVPPPAPAVSTPPPSGGFGERTLTVSFNTAIFAGIVALGVVFLAYAIGVRSGKAKAAAELTAAPADPAADPNAGATETKPGKIWTIQLLSWDATSSRDNGQAEPIAVGMSKSLEQAGFKPAWYDWVKKDDKRYLVLYYGRFGARTGEAQAKLAEVQKFKYKNQAHFARAGFVEIEQ